MASKSLRKPAVAGMFYAGTQSKLRRQIEWCFEHAIGPGKLPVVVGDGDGPRNIVGLISPHAGYPYSGPVAAHGFYELARDGKPDLAIILGPNHRGWGAPIAIDRSDVWQTPLGEVPLDVDVGRQIAETTPGAQLDDVAHVMEHSVEVQVPFLQFLYGAAFSIVPITILVQDLGTSLELGRSIAAAVGGKNALIVASTDFSHYESQAVAAQKDSLAIEHIIQMETDSLFEAIHHHGITMCGPGPVAAAISACKEMGARESRLLRYATSGDVAGDFSRVVGYASMKLEKKVE